MEKFSALLAIVDIHYLSRLKLYLECCQFDKERPYNSLNMGRGTWESARFDMVEDNDSTDLLCWSYRNNYTSISQPSGDNRLPTLCRIGTVTSAGKPEDVIRPYMLLEISLC